VTSDDFGRPSEKRSNYATATATTTSSGAERSSSQPPLSVYLTSLYAISVAAVARSLELANVSACCQRLDNMAVKMAAGSGDKTTPDLSTTTVTSRVNLRPRGTGRRRKSRKNSRRKQQRPKQPKQTTPRKTETGNVTSLLQTRVTDRVHEITTPTSGSSAGNSRSGVPGERRPLNRKLTTATNQYTGHSYVTSSVLLSPIATAVPYVNIGAETPRQDYVTSGELVWGEAGTSVATVIGLATVSVFAFWLVVTVIVLSCLLVRRTKMSAKPRTGCVVDNRWSWSGNQLIGLLDDTLDAPPENARLFSTERYDMSPPRWNSASDARRRDNNRTLTSYRFLRQQPTSLDELRPTQTELQLDSGYDTLAAATAAVFDAPEMDEAPEVTSYVERGQMDVWMRQREAIAPAVSCSQRRTGDIGVRTKQLTAPPRRFPRMGQS